MIFDNQYEQPVVFIDPRKQSVPCHVQLLVYKSMVFTNPSLAHDTGESKIKKHLLFETRQLPIKSHGLKANPNGGSLPGPSRYGKSFSSLNAT
jgi:hypothetical protein